jgi:hypothetical protein
LPLTPSSQPSMPTRIFDFCGQLSRHLLCARYAQVIKIPLRFTICVPRQRWE